MDMNVELVLTVLLITHVMIVEARVDEEFSSIAVGKLNLPSTYALFEVGRNGTVLADMNLEVWCAFKCEERSSCYFFADVNDKCIICIVDGTNTDSTMQPYTSAPLAASTQVYQKDGVLLRKVYEIGTTYVTYDGAQAACADLGMEMVTFASVQEFQALSQLIDASPVSGQMFWIDLLRQPDNTWVYADGGPDIPELWVSTQPDGDGPCAHLWIEYKFNDAACNSPTRMYICQVYTLI